VPVTVRRAPPARHRPAGRSPSSSPQATAGSCSKRRSRRTISRRPAHWLEPDMGRGAVVWSPLPCCSSPVRSSICAASRAR
jgi:hypothetical protein